MRASLSSCMGACPPVASNLAFSCFPPLPSSIHTLSSPDTKQIQISHSPYTSPIPLLQPAYTSHLFSCFFCPSLTMADEFLDLDEGSGETGVFDNLCLVGKILHHKTLNPMAVSNILKSAWKTRANFSIAPWNNNIFLFQFENEEDRASVLMDGPWSVMNQLLVLQPLQDGLAVNELEFPTCPFWVQIHGLPCEKMTRANAETIGHRFGKLLGVEGAAEGLLLNRSFLHVRVEVNLNQPLPEGFWLRKRTSTGRDHWISYKYEKLSDYCYACGQVGHENKECKFVSRDDGINSSFSFCTLRALHKD